MTSLGKQLPPKPQPASIYVAIPGTTRLENLKANLGAYDIELDSDEQATLDALADRVMGDRYDEQGMAIIDA